MNTLTKDDIKNSIEYKWRLSQMKIYLYIFAFFGFLYTFVIIISLLPNFGSMKLPEMLLIWLIVTLFFGSFLLTPATYYLVKAKLFLKNYSKFKKYTVLLNNPSTSYLYRGAVYYNVDIMDGGRCIKTSTSPYFSSSIFAAFTIEDYNNKKVTGLYDDLKGKLYLIK